MLNLKKVTDFAKEKSLPAGTMLSALKTLAVDRNGTLLLRVANERGRKVWFVDIDVLMEIYNKTTDLEDRVNRLELEVYGRE